MYNQMAPEKQTEIPKYQILHERRRIDNSFQSLEEVEMQYVQLTDRLINIMTNGREVIADGEYKTVVPSKVVFLDKSARPVAWLTRELWDTLAPEKPGDPIPKKPDFKFLNIDRNQWKDILDPLKTGHYDVSRLGEEEIEGLRSIFGKNHDGSFDAPNELDDQTIMIVDEVRASGATLNIATDMLKRAFPTSTVFGEHWMGQMTKVNNVETMLDLPIWYKDTTNDPKTELGRGVGNRRNPLLATHPSQLFLSTRFPEPDQQSLRLREDLRRLAKDVGKNVLYIPDRERENSDERTELINQRPAREVYLARRAIVETSEKRR